MRNGFRSSRGAMRGISGGTAGLATVAMLAGPFLYSSTRHHSTAIEWLKIASLLHLARPQNSFMAYRSANLPTTKALTVGRDSFFFQGAPPRVCVTAVHRTKVQGLASVAQRNRQNFRHVHSAKRIAHQAPRQPHGLRTTLDIYTLPRRWLSRASHHPGHQMLQ